MTPNATIFATLLTIRQTADADLTSDTTDVADLAARLHMAKEIVSHGRAVQAQIESALAVALVGTRGPVEIPGVGTVERKAGNVRKQWDHARLAPLVALRAAGDYDVDSGVPLPEYVAARVLECAGVSYWRVGALKQMGLRADDYCESETGRPTVILRVAESKEDAA